VSCAEAVVRGHKAALLSAADYASLQQCESLDDVKLFLVRSPPCTHALPPHAPSRIHSRAPL